MNRSKRYRLAAICFFIGAFGMFVSCILGNRFFMNFSLGCAMFTLGCVCIMKMRKEK